MKLFGLEKLAHPTVVFRETFRGSYHLLAEPLVEHAVDVHFIVRVTAFRRLLWEGFAQIGGTISLEGLADRAEAKGTVRFRLRSEKRVPYDVTFTGDDQRQYRFRGQREPHPVSPFEVFTNLRFALYDENDVEFGRGLVRCDLRGDLKTLITSVRLRLDEG